MAVASIWRRAWMRLRSRGSGEDDADGGGGRLRPTGGEDDANGGGGWLQSTSHDVASSGTTYIASTTTATSDSVGESQPREIHSFMAQPLPTTPVVEENAEEELEVLEEDRVEKLEHLKRLVVQFRGNNRGALERWLLELNVPWVVHLAPGTHESSGSIVASHGFQFLVQSWILALRKISGSILIILTSLDGWRSQRQDDPDQDEGMSKQPSASEFAEFVQAIVLKMLPFIDVIAATKSTHSHRPGAVAQKLQVLVDMHDALSVASQHVLSLLSYYVQEECSDDKMRELLSADLTKLDAAIWDTVVEMRELLSADLTKLDAAIWDTVVEMRNNIMDWTWTDGGGSSDIHMVTHSIVSYTRVLWANYNSVNRILHGAVLSGEFANYNSVNRILHGAVLSGEFVSENERLSHVANLITHMISSLEREPSTDSSPDESLRFLFLINNFHYLLQEFHKIEGLGFNMVPFTYDINYYINRYLHVSWESVLKCLQDPATPRCFTTYSSPIPKFESKFQKTYSTQKLWKVPDPEMRKRLRKTITDKVSPVFTQFLEDNHTATPPGSTTMNVEKMLGELFEG